VGVFLTDEEGATYPEALPTAMGYFLPLKPGGGECIFLDARGWCTVHDTRKPEVCRCWHCVDDFDEDGRPSGFLEDHPTILRWILARKESSSI
jgi:Fe-S-cluster containining protein